MKKLDSILLIDDDPICSWLNKTFLEDLQVANNIECFSDAHLALDYFKETCGNPDKGFPDLILLDINMPGIDGFQFLERLKKLEGCELMPASRVVFLTTSMHSRDMEKAQELQIKGYLVKPLTETKVRNLLKDLQKPEVTSFEDAAAKSRLNLLERQPLERQPLDRQPAEKPIKSDNKKSQDHYK